MVSVIESSEDFFLLLHFMWRKRRITNSNDLIRVSDDCCKWVFLFTAPSVFKKKRKMIEATKEWWKHTNKCKTKLEMLCTDTRWIQNKRRFLTVWTTWLLWKMWQKSQNKIEKRTINKLKGTIILWARQFNNNVLLLFAAVNIVAAQNNFLIELQHKNGEREKMRTKSFRSMLQNQNTIIWHAVYNGMHLVNK